MSVPAPFRTALRAQSAEGAAALVLRPSHAHSCIDAWPLANFEALAAGVDQLETFSVDQEDLTTTLYADAWPVEADKEGRIIVPDSLVQHAGLTHSVVFMGLGRWFQIWEPAAANHRKLAAREAAAARRLTLPGVRA